MLALSSIPDISILPQNAEPPASPFLDDVGVAPIAGFWRRLAAGVIDLLLLGIVGQIIGWPFSSFWFGVGPYGRFVGLLLILVYFGLMNSKFGKGQTLGKRLLGIAVRDDENKLISLSRSLVRATVLALPFILNGWELPIFQNLVVTMLMSIIIFGLGGAIIYTLIFNRLARQGLHDLLCNTYVVYLSGDFVQALPSSSRFHKVVAAAIVGLSALLVGGMGIATSLWTPGSSFGDLYTSYQTLQSDPRFFSASVFDNTMYSGGERSTRTLRVNVWYKGVPNREQFVQTTRDIAGVALTKIGNIDDFDLIEISVTSTYDLGIASGTYTSGDRQPPQVWRERVAVQNTE